MKSVHLGSRDKRHGIGLANIASFELFRSVIAVNGDGHLVGHALLGIDLNQYWFAGRQKSVGVGIDCVGLGAVDSLNPL